MARRSRPAVPPARIEDSIGSRWYDIFGLGCAPDAEFTVEGLPESVNECYESNGRRGGKHLTKAANAYLQAVSDAGCAVLPEPLAGPVWVRIRLVPRTNAVRDLDNCLKQIFDGLKCKKDRGILIRQGVIDDDRQIRKALVEWAAPDAAKPRVEIAMGRLS